MVRNYTEWLEYHDPAGYLREPPDQHDPYEDGEYERELFAESAEDYLRYGGYAY